MTGRRRLLVTGCRGQVAVSLVERGAGSEFEVIALGRPELDLSVPGSAAAAIARAAPDIVVSAAAYTAVDKAEDEEDFALRINAEAPGEIARAAAQLAVPVIHLSTDYVFDGAKTTPYVEEDPTGPLSAYGRSKLAGEAAVAAAGGNHAILRTAWVYGPHGRNFLKTMLDLSEREEVAVVDDQTGNPTSSLDLADAILRVARNLIVDPSPRLRGLFHVTAPGEGSWADFAEEIFSVLAEGGRHRPSVRRIASEDYQARAVRPKNSRLDCGRLAREHGVRLPDWRMSTAAVVRRLVGESGKGGERNRT
jgi:dTDP-4-dehydrorhamnose reductase